MNICLCTNVIKKFFLLIIPNIKSRCSNNTCQTTRLHCTQIILKIFLKIQQQKKGIFNDDGNLFQSELPLN